MTATTVTTGAPARTAVPARYALALLIPIGPLAIAALRAVLPYSTLDGPAQIATKMAAGPGAGDAVLWLTLIATITAVPAVIAVGLLAVRHAPRLGIAGLVLATAGFACLYGPASTDLAGMSAIQAGLGPAGVAGVVGAVHPSTVAATLVFVVGHVLGLVLLGIALWRGRAVPAWAALAIAVSQPLHFVFAVIVPNAALDATAWGVTTVGFAAVALTYARASR